MELYINAFAHYLPENRVPNSYFKEVNGLDDEWIRTRTGISTRSKAGENENTNTMALEAVKRLNEKLPFPIEGSRLDRGRNLFTLRHGSHGGTYDTAPFQGTRSTLSHRFGSLLLVYQRHGNCRRVFCHEQGHESHRCRLRAQHGIQQ